MIGSSRVPDLWTSLAISNPVTEAAGSRGRRLKLRPPFGALCEALVIVRDLKHHLLRYFVLHIIGKTARFVGEFAPRLTTTRRRKFIDGNHRPAHSLKRPDPPCWSDRPGLATTRGVLYRAG
jgi:hypothetical protein